MGKKQSSIYIGNEFNGYGEKKYLSASERRYHAPLSQENVQLSPDYSASLLKALGGVPVVINPSRINNSTKVMLGSQPVVNYVMVEKNQAANTYSTKINVLGYGFTNDAYPIHVAKSTSTAQVVKWTEYFAKHIEGTISIRKKIKDGEILAKCASGATIMVNEAETEDDGKWVWGKYHDAGKNKDIEGWVAKENLKLYKTRTIYFSESTYKNIKGWVEYTDKKKPKENATKNTINDWGQPGKGTTYSKEYNKKDNRYVVAVPPKIIIEDYPDSGEILESDFRPYSKYLKVYLKLKSEYKNTGEPKDLTIECVIGDMKAHSYSKYPYEDTSKNGSEDVKAAEVAIGNGMVQTGIKYPNVSAKANEAYVKFGTFSANVIEFCSQKVDFNQNHYYLIKIETNYEKTTRGIDFKKL